MTDEDLILHLTRKNAELEERISYLDKEANKVTRYWLDSTEEVKSLKVELLALQKEFIKDDLEAIEPKEVQNGGE